jgi:hypothetical protein
MEHKFCPRDGGPKMVQMLEESRDVDNICADFATLSCGIGKKAPVITFRAKQWRF